MLTRNKQTPSNRTRQQTMDAAVYGQNVACALAVLRMAGAPKCEAAIREEIGRLDRHAETLSDMLAAEQEVSALQEKRAELAEARAEDAEAIADELKGYDRPPESEGEGGEK